MPEGHEACILLGLSCADHLQSEVPRKIQDKRFGIELAALRQGIWADGELTHRSTIRTEMRLPGLTPAANWPGRLPHEVGAT